MEYLYTKEEKLKYVFEKLKLGNKEISRKLEMSGAMVSQIQSYNMGKLRKHHIYAICKAYNIPIEIFEFNSIKMKKQIDEILENSKNSIFLKDYKLLENLKGNWYLYSYPSNSKFTKVWETETVIYEDFSVEDMHGNRGKLLIGKNQSIILKESSNSKNITSITFDNSRVAYGKFLFSRVSKSNGINKELFNFGFFSRDRVNLDEATDILGQIDSVQLKIDHSLLERINDYVEIEG